MNMRIKQKNEKSIAIVILHWGKSKDTFNLLESLTKIQYENYKIFLLDQKGDLDVKKINKRISFIIPKHNLGFSGGNNYVIKKFLNDNFDYFLTLNNDTIVEPNFLAHMVDAADNNSKIAAIGPTILFEKPSYLIWYAGGKLSLITGSTKHFHVKKKIRNVNQRQVRAVSFITGCCMLMRTDALKRIGLFDDRYFVYYEDADWCARAIKLGYKLIYQPKAKVYHKISNSLGVNSPQYLYYTFRNKLLFIRKNISWYWRGVAWLNFLFNALREFVKIILVYRKDYSQYFKMILKSIVDNSKRKYGKL